MVPLPVRSYLMVCVQVPQFSVIPYLREVLAFYTRPKVPGLTLRKTNGLGDAQKSGSRVHTFNDFTVKSNLQEVNNMCTDWSRARADHHHITTEDGSNLHGELSLRKHLYSRMLHTLLNTRKSHSGCVLVPVVRS